MKNKKIVAYLVCLVCTFVVNTNVYGQLHKNYIDEFLSTQWWLGVRLGTNFSAANPTQRFTGITPINFESNSLDKVYDDYRLAGVFAGLDITFYHKGFSISFQPNFRRSRFSYQNDLFWESTDGIDRFETETSHEQRIDFFDVPILVKYDLLKSAIRPYVMVGGYVSFVTNAEKELSVIQRDISPNSIQQIEAADLIIGVRDNFGDFDYGVIGGVGASYDFWNIRAILEGSYRLGLTNIVNQNNRFLETQLTSIGDVNDDIELRSINVSLSLVFPLRFISKQFQAF